ncbi:MAG TPA: hypothetical protein VMT93_00710 [Gemmatimonadaceae bacterium]|nr:hypothetical protein [Gemmatimonadaceae bacterium]
MNGLVFLVPITLFVCVTVIVLAAMSRRGRSAAIASPRLDEIAQRLERMEQAIDAMAVETERIAEGQRFTTKLLSERAPAGREQ